MHESISYKCFTQIDYMRSVETFMHNKCMRLSGDLAQSNSAGMAVKTIIKPKRNQTELVTHNVKI